MSPAPNAAAIRFTGIRKFNLMFKTFQGGNGGQLPRKSICARRRRRGSLSISKMCCAPPAKSLPFGIGQIGKSFRNEITPGNFIFRIREFEQMELEFFCMPGEDLEWFSYWKEFCIKFSILYRPQKRKASSLRDHDKAELSHYSNATTDIEFRYPFGVKELWGIADRTDFDLKAHAKESGEALEYMDPTTGQKVVPYCIEPSVGRGSLNTGPFVRCI